MTLFYTIQLAQHHLCKQSNIPLLDTTVKSGDAVFAPSWAIVRGVKSGELTEADYTLAYDQLMRQSFTTNRDRWKEICQMEQVAIACYCKPSKFCHRHLLVPKLTWCCQHWGLPYSLGGELTRERLLAWPK